MAFPCAWSGCLAACILSHMLVVAKHMVLLVEGIPYFLASSGFALSSSMLDWRVAVRATPGRWDSRRKRGGCDGRATATEPDMVVVTELELVNMSVGRLWDGLAAGGTRADSGWKACSCGIQRAGAKVRATPTEGWQCAEELTARGGGGCYW